MTGMEGQMRTAEQFQIRKIYAIGSALGIVDRACGCDELHALVGSMTGKDSIKSLTYGEASEVIARLQELQGRSAPPAGSREGRKCGSRPGGITAGQQKKVWALMYELKKHDEVPNTVPLGNRLCRIIKKELHVDAAAKDPFVWMDFEQGNRLIEILKKYVASAKRKESV